MCETITFHHCLFVSRPNTIQKHVAIALALLINSCILLTLTIFLQLLGNPHCCWRHQLTAPREQPLKRQENNSSLGELWKGLIRYSSWMFLLLCRLLSNFVAWIPWRFTCRLCFLPHKAKVVSYF